MKIKALALSVILAVALVAAPQAQTLSDQVLLLLSRVNSWSAAQTFTDVTITGTCTGCGGAGGGTVTSVAQTVPSILTISGSPIVGSGTLAIGLATQADHTALIGPLSGGPTAPTFRLLVDDDIPDTITIAGTNNVTWASVNKTGSDSADLATFDVDDVTGGTLALANLTDNDVTADLPLVSGGAGGDPVYEALDLTSSTAITGQLAAANFPALTGDITTAGGALATTLASTGVAAATYGSTSQVPQITVDVKGRITAASNLTIATSALLSTTYCSDCTASTPTRGDLMYVPVGGSWDDLPVGTAGQALFADGTDIAWGVDGTSLNIDVDNATAGTLALARGGTAAAITAVNGGIIYSTASALAVSAAGTVGQCLTSNGAAAPTWGACATLAAHNLLSATHGDTAASSVVRGGVIVGNSTPEWSQLAAGASGTFLSSDGTDVSWSSDGSGLTSLNASNLTLGTVPTARLAPFTFSLFDPQTTALLFAIISDEVQPTGGVLAGTVPWTDVAFSAGNFTGSGSMTWTVESGDQDIFQYTITGDVMTVSFDIATTTVGGTLDTQLEIAIPGGVTVATPTGGGSWIQTCWRIDNTTEAATVCSVDSAGTQINVFHSDNTTTTWAASTNASRVAGVITFQIE
jgi:hypothetical protein